METIRVFDRLDPISLCLRQVANGAASASYLSSRLFVRIKNPELRPLITGLIETLAGGRDDEYFHSVLQHFATIGHPMLEAR